MKKLTGAQIVIESLLAEGVNTVFGYPGGAILPTYDALILPRFTSYSCSPRTRGRAYGGRVCARVR